MRYLKLTNGQKNDMKLNHEICKLLDSDPYMTKEEALRRAKEIIKAKNKAMNDYLQRRAGARKRR